jgi:hypothetical protein
VLIGITRMILDQHFLLSFRTRTMSLGVLM